MTETAVADPVTELADLQLRVWRKAADVASDYAWDADETLAALDLPSADLAEHEAIASIAATVGVLRSEDVPGLLAAYPNRVRRAAAEVATDMGWCSFGLNQALREMGLPEWDGSYATATVTLRLVDTDPQRTPLTAQELAPLLRAYSDDEDVVVVMAPAVSEVVYDGVDPRMPDARQLIATVELRLLVEPVASQDTAGRWIRNSVSVEPHSDYVGLGLVDETYLAKAAIVWDDDALPE